MVSQDLLKQPLLSPKNSMPNDSKKTPLFQSPRGMRDLLEADFYAMQGLFERAQEIATYYGFSPIATPLIEYEEIFTRTSGESSDIVTKEMYHIKTKGEDKLALRPEGTAPIMRAYIEHGMRSMPQPVLLYYGGPFFRHDKPQKGRYRQLHQFGIEALGTQKSIADALIIKTILAILHEAGAENFFVDVNTIGDKESRIAYTKALTSFYKKHAHNLPREDQERLEKNPLRILDSKHEITKEINEQAPDNMNFLNASSKKHFKEVLESLEEMGVHYRLNKQLVRGLDYYSHTVFEVINYDPSEEHEGLALGGGGRYDYLASAMGYPQDIPGVGAGLGMDRIIESSWYKRLTPRLIKKPKFYLIQLGFEAKLKTLNILEILRKAKCPVYQTLSKDRLSVQLALAEKMNVPYVLIFGQREALDGTVIVRSMKTRKQECVRVTELAKYIKTLK